MAEVVRGTIVVLVRLTDELFRESEYSGVWRELLVAPSLGYPLEESRAGLWGEGAELRAPFNVLTLR